jgi:uncharacterized protein YndB with AHSA1/START domain
MATTIITPDNDAIVSEIDIAAPPERVFKSITDPEEIRRRSPELKVFEMDARVGGRWYLEMPLKQPYKGVSGIRHEGEILEIVPPRLLVYTWLANFHDDPLRRTIVRWELTPTKSGTHVKLTHSGLLLEPASRKDYSGGWPGVLQELKKSVEQ